MSYILYPHFSVSIKNLNRTKNHFIFEMVFYYNLIDSLYKKEIFLATEIYFIILMNPVLQTKKQFSQQQNNEPIFRNLRFIWGSPTNLNSS